MHTTGLATIILKMVRRMLSNTITHTGPAMDSRHILSGMVDRVVGIEELYISLVVFTIHLLTTNAAPLDMEPPHEFSLISATSLETLPHMSHYLPTSQAPYLLQCEETGFSAHPRNRWILLFIYHTLRFLMKFQSLLKREDFCEPP